MKELETFVQNGMAAQKAVDEAIAAVDQGNMFMVRRSRVGIHVSGWNGEPLSSAEALNMARWLFAVANPLLAQWIASMPLEPASAYSRDVHDFRDAMRRVLATPK